MQFRNEFVLGFSSVRHLVSLRFVLLRFHCGCVTRQQLPLSRSLSLGLFISLYANLTNLHLNPLVPPCAVESVFDSVCSVGLFICLSILPSPILRPRWLCSYLSGLFVIWFCVFTIAFRSRTNIFYANLRAHIHSIQPDLNRFHVNSVAPHLFAICDCFRYCGLFWRCHVWFHSSHSSRSSHSSHSDWQLFSSFLLFACRPQARRHLASLCGDFSTNLQYGFNYLF